MKNRYLLIILFAGVLLAGCRKNEPPDPVDTDPKTLIMFGDISTFPTYNVATAGAAIAKGALIEGQQVVYYQYDSKGGTLYRLVKNAAESDSFESVPIKSYEDGISGFDPDKLRKIIVDAREAAPANHYGLSIGSHGSGWVTYSLWTNRSARSSAALNDFAPLFEPRENSLTRYMYSDGNYRWIEVTDFAKALDGLHFDFILLDQCFMGGIEVAFELKDIASHLIVSPAEIIIYGFPFDRVVGRLFKNWNDLTGVCMDFINYYKNSSNPYGTISLVKTSELPTLARATKAIVDSQGGGLLTPAGGISGLQYYEGLSTHLFYDFGQYIKNSTPKSYSSLYDTFEEALGRAIPYMDHTDTFLSALSYGRQEIPVDYYSGLSAYVPDTSTSAFLDAYRETSWYKAVYE